MEVIYLLVPVSVILVFLIAIAFWMSVKGGQFDDLEGPGFKILMDDDKPQTEVKSGEVDGKADEGKKQSPV